MKMKDLAARRANDAALHSCNAEDDVTLNYASSQTNGRPRTVVVVLTGILSASVLLSGLFFLVFGLNMCRGAYALAAVDKLLAVSATALGGALFMAGVLTFIFISLRRKMIRKWTLAAIALSIACSIWSLIVGLTVVVDAQRRGGPGVGVGVAVGMIFCVIFPGILGLMTLGIGAILLRWKPLQ